MNTENKKLSVTENRNYKDTLFRMIFKEPRELLSLYNALNNTTYTNPDDLKIITLENAIYMNVKNDVACVLDCHLNLYEHQSTVNPNMPLRDLLYVAREYEILFADDTIYSTKLRKIPAPHFIVFYNGSATQPEYLEMKLSDAYEIPVQNPALELKVIQLNINAGYNKELMNRCKTLQEYSLYVDKVRKYVKKKPLKEAVEQTVTECIKDGILSQFLTRYRAEAISMSIFEYDEEKELALIRRDERNIGMEEGMLVGIEAFLSLCEDLKLSQEETRSKLMEKFSLSEQEALHYLQKKNPA
ncbi:MAG: hypothetical protein IJX66_00385 [Lachnospiraceae bacterium]|nr:hypothetical protein [Lachnospiraceae bacterium]